MGKTALNPGNMESVATRFRILGVPLRLQILNELSDGERTVTVTMVAVTMAAATRGVVTRGAATVATTGTKPGFSTSS